MLKFSSEHAFLQEDIMGYQPAVSKYHDQLMNKTGLGNDFVGWVEWPNCYDKEEFARILKAAKEIREKCEVFLVCGIGGSYLGARAVIEMVNGVYNDAKPEIIFIGNQ